MSQQNGKYGKHRSIFTHPHPQADSRDLQTQWQQILKKNPGIKHLLEPDYQYNYYDPPHDEITAEFLKKLEKKFPFRRQSLLRRFLPQDLHQFKVLMAKLPYSQLQQLREHVYIARVGNLGTNRPCKYTRRHWVYRLSNGNEIITSDTIKKLPTAEIIRWYTTAINNLYVDSAEEEYLRYKLCINNALPLVNTVGPHNPTHYDPSDGLNIDSAAPPKACEALMPMVHSAHRHFMNKINDECGRHFEPFYQAFVRDRDLNMSLIKYEKIQRCTIGREIRARIQSEKPVLLPAYQLMGHTFGLILPPIFTNWITIKSNDVLKFSEPDSDCLPIFNGQNIPHMKPLLDELRQELIFEGKLPPEPITTSSFLFSSLPSEIQQQQQNNNAIFDDNFSNFSPYSTQETPYRFVPNGISPNEAFNQKALQAQPTGGWIEKVKNWKNSGEGNIFSTSYSSSSQNFENLSSKERNERRIDQYSITSPDYQAIDAAKIKQQQQQQQQQQNQSQNQGQNQQWQQNQGQNQQQQNQQHDRQNQGQNQGQNQQRLFNISNNDPHFNSLHQDIQTSSFNQLTERELIELFDNRSKTS